ncbi:MAG: SusD/RagB family nutrient-binding outer membrane lipoprotein [Flavobacteriaceae bacterium]|nr:SusD/RagB family nutrient-binding outer membrane lipoprotein [Flavobacteriaceae bacterium]
MKKTVYLIILSLVVISCDFDKGFEELNTSPTSATQIDVNNKFASVFLRTSGERYENWRASLIYSSTIVQHIASTGTYWSGNFYLRNFGYATSLWDRGYPQQVKEIEDIVNQLTVEENNGTSMGVARIWRSFIYHRLTDIYGDIPYSEAGKGYTDGILKPKYDPQSEIYASMLSELEAAVAQLGEDELGNSDLIYGGDVAQWRKFGNSLMLRLAMRMTKVDAAGAQAWASKAINGGTFESNDDICFIQHTAGPEGINKNGHGEVFTADGNPRISKFFIDQLKSTNDPRLPILAARRSDGSTAPEDLMGLPSATTNAALIDMFRDQFPPEVADNDIRNHFAEPNRGVITGEDAPMVFQTYAETEFLKAEAAVRGWYSGDAEQHYSNGVRAAMQMLSQLYPNAAAISDEQVDAYLAANPFDADDAMNHIHTQYWIATFLNEYEAFANWRRTGYPELQAFGGQPVYAGNVTNGTIPRRLIYPNSEESTNPENFAEAISRQGPNEFTTRVWWDK